MNLASLQWILLIGYTFLFAWAGILFYRIPRIRPMATTVLFIALSHAIYYFAFLIKPEWLDYDKTMLFSLVIRLQVLFSLLIGLSLIQRRRGWK